MVLLQREGKEGRGKKGEGAYFPQKKISGAATVGVIWKDLGALTTVRASTVLNLLEAINLRRRKIVGLVEIYSSQI